MRSSRYMGEDSGGIRGARACLLLTRHSSWPGGMHFCLSKTLLVAALRLLAHSVSLPA